MSGGDEIYSISARESSPYRLVYDSGTRNDCAYFVFNFYVFDVQFNELALVGKRETESILVARRHYEKFAYNIVRVRGVENEAYRS